MTSFDPSSIYYSHSSFQNCSSNVNKRPFPFDFDKKHSISNAVVKKIKVNHSQYVQIPSLTLSNSNHGLYFQHMEQTLLKQKTLIEAYQVSLRNKFQDTICNNLEKECEVLFKRLQSLQALKQMIKARKSQAQKQSSYEPRALKLRTISERKNETKYQSKKQTTCLH